jgi:hypothetical protein
LTPSGGDPENCNLLQIKPMAKAAAKSTPKATSGKDRPIKYADKSAGQPEMILIFEELKKMVKPFAKGTMVERGDGRSTYGLWSDKEIEVSGRKMLDVHFAGLMIQKGFVGFYFMPVYSNPKLKAELHPDLAKCLKGKCCFHIKKNDSALMQHVKDALKVGLADYKKKDWA